MSLSRQPDGAHPSSGWLDETQHVEEEQSVSQSDYPSCSESSCVRLHADVNLIVLNKKRFTR